MPRTAAPLTVRSLDALKPPESGVVEWFDGSLPGFLVRVTSEGRKSFNVLYRVKGSRELRRFKIGTYPPLSLADAREKARDVVAQAQLGIDARTPARVESSSGELTVESLWNRYVLANQSKLAPSTAKERERLVRKHILPAFGSRGVNSIRRLEVTEWGQRIRDEGAPVVANRAHTAGARLFNWGIKAGLPIDHSPFHGVEKPSDEEHRERVLTDDEIVAIFNATDRDYPGWRIFWDLGFFTGARKAPILGARWEDFDWKERVWTIPRVSMKGRKRTVVIPLVGRLFTGLRAQRKLTGHTPWVLAHPKGKKALSNPYRTIERVAAAAGVTDWHFHDIRHTISTNLGRLRVPQEIIDRVMQHTVGSKMSRTYNQWEYVDQKREALEKWADHLETILGEGKPSVASFGSRRER